MKAALIFVFWFQGVGIPLACINTTYSRTDEVEITSDLGYLIIGAFAHHGPAFYENEVKRCLKLLADDPQHFEARNDLGAAYTKLGMWEKAQAAFERNEELHPARYETASNLGVMYKKMGEYAEAESWIRKSLQLKPGGHMGLGDYYLLMIQWQQQKGQSLETENAGGGEARDADADANETATPIKNFLGVHYAAGSAATAKVANKEYVVTLIKNDISFSDAYLVLGDILFEEKNYQLALRAYHRASRLSLEQNSQPHSFIAGKRQANVITTWQAEAQPGHVIEEGPGWYDQLEDEVAAAAEWLEEFQKVEAVFIEKGLDVSFLNLKPEVEKQGFAKPRLLEAVYYEGTEADGDVFFRSIVVVGLFAAVGSVVVLLGICVAIVIYFSRRKRPASLDEKIVKT